MLLMFLMQKRKPVLDEEDKITEDLKEILRVKNFKIIINQAILMQLMMKMICRT